jgi:Arc/MetJ-type ribon-helix-helix transcriptional regulator
MAVARSETILISLPHKQLRLVRQRVDSGQYKSANEVIREGLNVLFKAGWTASPRHSSSHQRRLAAGYKAMAIQDRKSAHDWAQLPEAWPEN